MPPIPLLRLLFETYDPRLDKHRLAAENSSAWKDYELRVLRDAEDLFYVNSLRADSFRGYFQRRQGSGQSPFIWINKPTKIVVIDSFMSPETFIALRSINTTYPQFRTYRVVEKDTLENTVPNIHSGYAWSPSMGLSDTRKAIESLDLAGIARLGDVVGDYKTFKGKSSLVNVKRGEYAKKNAEFEVLRDVGDYPWYHATTESNWKKIQASGYLKTSKTFKQGKGWTNLNFDLQNAVYLTSDLGYAEQIADTLVGRGGEPAVILQVSGADLDKKALVVDEDELRDDYEGNVGRSSPEDLEYPEYIRSAAGKVRSVGYRRFIPVKLLKVQSVVQPEKEEEDETDSGYHT